ISWTIQVTIELGQPGRTGGPVGHTVGGRAFDVEVRCGPGDLKEPFQYPVLASETAEIPLGQGVEELKLLGVAAEDPGKATRPCCEWRIPLLRARAAVGAVVRIEERLMGDAAAYVVHVATPSIVDVKARGGLRVLQEAGKEGDAPVVLSHQRVAEPVGKREAAQGADGVREERMGPVEGVDEAETVRERGPPGGLDGARYLEGQLIEAELALSRLQATRP